MRILLVEDEPRLAKTLAKGMQAERLCWTSCCPVSADTRCSDS
jgi:DNA-binding response OmpR family regulator